MHLGNDRLGHVPHVEESFHHVPRPVPEPPGGVERRVLAGIALQIVTGRKAGPGPADNGDPNRIVAIGVFERVKHFRAQLVGQRVALVRTIQRYAANHGPRLVDDDLLVFHELLPAFGSTDPVGAYLKLNLSAVNAANVRCTSSGEAARGATMWVWTPPSASS